MRDEVMNDLRMPQKRGTWAKWDKRCGATRTTSPRWGEAQAAFGRRSWHEGRRCEASAMALLRAGEGASMHRISARLPPHPEQPATWVTVLTGDMGNTFPVLFRSAVVVGPVDPVGNASSRCPQVHRPFALVCAGGRHHAR